MPAPDENKKTVQQPTTDQPSDADGGNSAGTECPPARNNSYLLETVSRACDVLKCFEDSEQDLKLRDIIRQTGLNKTIAFRILHTLTERGMLERSANLSYRSRVTFAGRRRVRLGYAAQAEESSFSAAVTAGIRLAAARRNIELIMVDNCYSAAVALKNAKKLADIHVDVAVEFQTHTKIASAVSTVFREAGIPLLAIEIPHPDAVFYGADNYRIGLLAGRVLGNWAKQHWGRQVEQVLLLEAAAAGPLPQLRLSGARTSIHEVLPHLPQNAFFSLEARWDFLRSFEAVRKHLRRSPSRSTIITGINDMVVLGALRAFEEAGRSQDCVAVCLGAIPEARAEMRRKGTRLIGAVAFFPERYGDDIIRLALDILHHRDVPPAVYAHFEFVTAASLPKLYPIDASGQTSRLSGASAG